MRWHGTDDRGSRSKIESTRFDSAPTNSHLNCTVFVPDESNKNLSTIVQIKVKLKIRVFKVWI